MFRIGQKVICIDGDFSACWGNVVRPTAGEVYTVRSIVPDFLWGDATTSEALLLYEIRNPVEYFDDWTLAEQPFSAHRFRPIVERKTDISIFEEILRRESMPDECAPAAVYGVDWGASA